MRREAMGDISRQIYRPAYAQKTVSTRKIQVCGSAFRRLVPVHFNLEETKRQPLKAGQRT
jgi:hypothetical protein